MECDVCSRPSNPNLPFFCPTCARNVLYQSRLEAASLLLDKDGLNSRIEHLVTAGLSRDGRRQFNDKQDVNLARHWTIQTLQTRKDEAERRLGMTREALEVKRQDIQKIRDDKSACLRNIAKRKEDIAVIKRVTPARRTLLKEKIAGSVEKGTNSWLAIHLKTVETKAFSCREAAVVSQLRQKERARDGVVTDLYSIGGLTLPDLREINGMKINEMNTSLSNVARLVHLVAFYLAVRLPSELTLPHAEYPHPTIFTPASSYSGRDVPFPDTSSTPETSSRSATGRQPDHRPLPRPRPLFLEPKDVNEILPQLAKRDPAAFNFYVEGVSLLAWNIAWLCRTQGIYAGTNTWEEVSNMGRNLWELLVTQTAPSTLPQAPVVKKAAAATLPSSTDSGKDPSNPNFAARSHSSTYAFLDGATVQEALRGWKLAKYTMLVDPLKRSLMGDISNAEWELLQEDEWDDGAERFDGSAGTVHVASRKMEGQAFDDARSIMTARTMPEDTPSTAPDPAALGREKGKSGWTVVRDREK